MSDLDDLVNREFDEHDDDMGDYELLCNLDEYDQGHGASLNGMLKSANPYPNGTTSWRSWNLGWEETKAMLRASGL